MQRKLEWSVSRFLLGNVALAILTDDLSGFYTFTFTFTFTLLTVYPQETLYLKVVAGEWKEKKKYENK